MFGNFTEEARKVLTDAKKEMYELKHPYVGSEHLLLSILKNDNKITKKLKSYNLDYKTLKDELIKIIGKGSKSSDWFLYTPLLKRVIDNAIMDSKENNNGEVTTNHLFSSLLEEGEGVAIRIIHGLNINLDDLYNEFNNKLIKNKKSRKLIIEELGVDLTKKAANNELDPVIGREKELRRVLEILSRRTKNNPLLIGEAGVGKTAIVEELSRMIASGDVPIALKNKRIISLNMASTVAGTKYRGEFEERINKILKELEENQDLILFIDEMHTLVGAGGAEGAIDASNIFKPALSRNKLRCIGATTTDEYKKYIEIDGALERRFQKVLIDKPDVDVLKQILMKLKPIYEKYHFVSIGEEIIDTIISLSEKYVYDRHQPDKAIDILDEVCARVSLKETKELKKYKELTKNIAEIIKKKNEAIVNNNFQLASKYKEEENQHMNEVNNIEINLYKQSIKEVRKEDVANVVSVKTKIPVYELLKDKNYIIKTIAKNLKKEVIGQEEAVTEMINIAKKIKLGFKDDDKCYSMLFCGPSGVGKTKLARIFGENLVGVDNVIKLDMSEYKESHTVSKILGAPPGYVGYSDNKNVLEQIRNKPFSVLIVDEIEKANESIINLFFQILDEGVIKDATGREVRFDNVVVIMTSNIGFNDINIGFNKNKDKVTTKLKEYFSIPFINRINNVITFDNLNKDAIEKIMLNKINDIKTKYSKKNVKIKISKTVHNEIIDLSDYEEFGARKIGMIVKNKLENIIIENMLEDNNDIMIKTIKDSTKV